MAGSKLSDFDRRIAAGSKVVAKGEAAFAYTPRRLIDEVLVAVVPCACGRRGHIGHYAMVREGRGDILLGQIAGRLVCSACGRPGGELQVVDPFRSALD